MKVTPNMVSARVVKMVNSKSLSFTLNWISAPSLRLSSFSASLSEIRSSRWCQVRPAGVVRRQIRADTTGASFSDYGEAAAFRYAVYHLVIGKHGTQLRTPVYHCFTQIGDAVVHQTSCCSFCSLAFHSSAVKCSSSLHAAFSPSLPDLANASVSSSIGRAFFSSLQ